MPTFQFEAMDATGQEIRDEIDAPSEDEAQTTIRQMGYFVTKISVKKSAAKTTAGGKKKRPFAMGGGQAQARHGIHSAIVDFARRRFADSAQFEDSGKQCQARQAEKRLDGRLR